MPDPPDRASESVVTRAVWCGRLVCVVVGLIVFAVPCWFAYNNPASHVLLAALVMGVGLVLVWLGIALPPKLVAHFGFWLAWFLPS